MTRPSETITAAVGSIIGALFIILGIARDGIDVALDSMEFQGAIITIVGWIAYGVTWFVAAKQRAGKLTSGPAGEVQLPH